MIRVKGTVVRKVVEVVVKQKLAIKLMDDLKHREGEEMN